MKTAPTSLLETVRALDGSKSDRHAIAHDALTSAYTQALKHGNKTQLSEMLESTGKKICERAMRQAIQVVGVPGKYKGPLPVIEAIEAKIFDALDIFASIACKEPKPKAAPVATSPVATSPAATTPAAAPDDTALLADLLTGATAPASQVQGVLNLIKTGLIAQDDAQALYDALIEACVFVRPAHKVEAQHAVH